MLSAMRDESFLILLGLKYLLTNMVTGMVAALAQGSDPKHTEVAVAFHRLWAQSPYGEPLLSQLSECSSELRKMKLHYREPSATGK